MSIYTDFRNFVFAQDDEHTIDHNSGWCGCAIGDFFRSHKKQLKQKYEIESAYEVPGTMGDAAEYITVTVEMLNDLGYWAGISINEDFQEEAEAQGLPSTIETYGDLKEFITFAETYYGTSKRQS